MVKLTRIYTRRRRQGPRPRWATAAAWPSTTRALPHTARSTRPTPASAWSRLHLADDAEVDEILARAQNDLFDLGADLCTARDRRIAKKPALRITADAGRARLEAGDRPGINADARGRSKSFVLPGGSAGRRAICTWRAP